MKLSSDQFNYVVTSASEPPPCHEMIRREDTGALYRCEQTELQRLLGN